MATSLPLSPFVTDPDNRFVLDEDAFMRGVLGLDDSDDLPAFISDPSPDFIAAMHRDVLPLLEDAVRRG